MTVDPEDKATASQEQPEAVSAAMIEFLRQLPGPA
jgi:hypothetical protein